MPKSRPFAFNTGSTIFGTTQYGDIAVGEIEVDYSTDYGGVKWWMGPDEDLGYVIGLPSENQPSPVGPAKLSFYRSGVKTDDSYLDLINYLAGKNSEGPFTTIEDGKNWLSSEGYYKSSDEETPTPSPTATPTSSPTATPTSSSPSCDIDYILVPECDINYILVPECDMSYVII